MAALDLLDLRGRMGPFAGLLPRPVEAGSDVHDAVVDILTQVRTGGDRTLLALTKAFDGVEIDAVRVEPSLLKGARDRVPDDLRAALELAWTRIFAYHAAESEPAPDVTSTGIRVRHLTRPVARAGCYAPGGRARYPSTVLMCAAPARVAGVAEVALCVPPAADGEVDPATLAAADIAGIDEVYRVGGAQAIAALAYGTESIVPVDVIVGPGNRYVAEAKRQVSGVVGIASAFAGPSEVVVVAGPETTPRFAAIDLVVQAEHGPDGMAWLLTWSEDVAARVNDEVAAIVAASPRRADLESTFAHGGFACVVDGPETAFEVSNEIAPEHLEILLEEAEAWLPLVTSAGAVFLGPWSPASLGDYLAGPNHVLPTNRTARFASALSADDFRKKIHAVSATRDVIRDLGDHVITLATVEGLPAHADSIRYRQ